MEILDIYYMKDIYYLIIGKKNKEIYARTDIDEYPVMQESDFVSADYKGNLLEEVGLIRLFS